MSRTATAAALAHIAEAARADPSKMGAEWVPVLKEVPLLAGLSRRHLRRVAALARAVRFPANATVVRAGARGDTFYVVIDGHASVSTAKGTTLLGPMDFFGEMSLLDGGPRSATVVAESELLTMRLSRSSFVRLLHEEPSMALSVMRVLVERVRRAEASPSA